MCGYFSSRLERAGLTVDAIEIGSVRAEIMRKLRDAAGLRFRIIGEPYENLALDEALLDEAERAGSPLETLRLWEPLGPMVVVLDTVTMD